MVVKPEPLIVHLSVNTFWFYVALYALYPFAWLGLVSADTCARLCSKCIRCKVS